MHLGKCQPVLFVKDAGVSTKFYVDVLGCTVVMDNGGANITFKEGFTVWQFGMAISFRKQLVQKTLQIATVQAASNSVLRLTNWTMFIKH